MRRAVLIEITGEWESYKLRKRTMIKSTRGMTLLVAIGMLLLAVGVSACGGGGSSDSTSSSTEASSKTSSEEAPGSEEEATSTEEVSSELPTPPTTEPSKNPVTIPLSKTPPKGKKLVYLQCELPACETEVATVREAAEALGWTVEALVFNSAEPGKSLTTALQEKPDYILTSGVPQAVLAPQLKEAHEQGVPVLATSEPERPTPDGFATASVGSQEEEGELLASWMINDSKGEAQVVGVSLPLYPILTTQTEGAKTILSEDCSKCSYGSLDVTPEDLASGDIPQKVVAYLQSHPETNYVYTSYGELTTGLWQVLKSAGYADKVKIVSGSGPAAAVSQVPEHVVAAVSTPQEFISWGLIDSAARLSIGETISKEYEEQIWEFPVWILDSKESAESVKGTNYEWPGPGNFKSEFEELWGVK
jgi:ABC-type sugar transport system substrate-binding protein